jgi:hypothetical protein
LEFSLEEALKIEQTNECLYLIERNGESKVSYYMDGEAREGLLPRGTKRHPLNAMDIHESHLKIRCVIYDCDGVLFDSLEANGRLYSEVCVSDWETLLAKLNCTMFIAILYSKRSTLFRRMTAI